MNPKLSIECFNEIPLGEQQEINGGIWPIIVSIGIIAIEEVIRDWDNFKNGLTGKPEEK